MIRQDAAAAQQSVSALLLQRAELDLAIERQERAIVQLQARTPALEAETETAAAALADLQRQLSSLTLQCGGASYETCPDSAARQRYDHARYELNSQIGRRRATLATLRQAVIALRRDIGEARRIRTEKMVERASSHGAIGSHRLRLRTISNDLALSEPILARREAALPLLAADHGADTELVTRLQTLISD